MNLLNEPADPREIISREIGRLHDRLLSMSADRLAAQLPPWPSRAAAAHATARRLSLLAQGIEWRSSLTPASYRELPDVPDRVVADQLAVCAADLLLAAEGLPDDTPVWNGVVTSHLGATLAEAGEALSALRRTL